MRASNIRRDSKNKTGAAGAIVRAGRRDRAVNASCRPSRKNSAFARAACALPALASAGHCPLPHTAQSLTPDQPVSSAPALAFLSWATANR
jgi:hypothetical protein